MLDSPRKTCRVIARHLSSGFASFRFTRSTKNRRTSSGIKRGAARRTHSPWRSEIFVGRRWTPSKRRTNGYTASCLIGPRGPAQKSTRAVVNRSNSNRAVVSSGRFPRRIRDSRCIAPVSNPSSLEAAEFHQERAQNLHAQRRRGRRALSAVTIVGSTRIDRICSLGETR